MESDILSLSIPLLLAGNICENMLVACVPTWFAENSNLLLLSVTPLGQVAGVYVADAVPTLLMTTLGVMMECYFFPFPLV